MTFEKYLAQTRRYHVKINPSRYADEYRDELDYHVSNVLKWINGDTDRDRMIKTLDFFGTKFSASGKVYRGTEYYPRFDGKPASYTKSLEVAEGFGEDDAESHWFFPGNKFYVVERNALKHSIDLQKMLKSYATGKLSWSEEKEVIMLNTPTSDKGILEYDLA